jgi:hypothetical protein
MTTRRAYRYEIRPDGHQRKLLAKFCGTVRWLWNQQLALYPT